jgi:hypothetical protein
MSICNTSSSVSRDAALSSLTVSKNLVACKISSNEIGAVSLDVDGATVEELVATNLTVLNSIAIDPTGTGGGAPGTIASEYLADDSSTATADASGVLTVSGGGGNVTSASGSTLNVTDLRNLSAYVVGPSATDSEYTDIQTAIDAAAAAGGGIVLVKRGVYSGFILNNPTVTVKGVGQSVQAGIASPSVFQAGVLENLVFFDTVICIQWWLTCLTVLLFLRV